MFDICQLIYIEYLRYSYQKFVCSMVNVFLSEYASSLTERCWAADMNARPSFLEILKGLEKIKETLPPDHHWGLFT